MDPFVERDAFINQLNQQRMQNQIAFNSGGMTDPTAGMTPGLNYQQAMQQAGLGGGAPSMAANYGDSLIQRLNQSFGGQGDPFTFANQQGYYQPPQPQQGFSASLAQQQLQQAMQDQGPGREVGNPDGTTYWVPDKQPAAAAVMPSSPASASGGDTVWTDNMPSATLPVGYQWEKNPGLSPSWTAKRRLSVYDGRPTPEGEWQISARNPNAPILFYPKGARDADMSYGEWPKDQPLPQSQNSYSPVSTAGPTPPKVPQAKDPNRAQFLQDKAYGRIDSPTATYDSYVKTTLENVTGQVVNSPGGVELYNQYQSSDPAKRLAAAERLKSLIYDRALQQGVAPGDEWFSKKTGKSAFVGRDQYFNDAMAKYSAKQSPVGKAQSIQPPSKGMPYGQAPTLPPGTTEADIWQSYKDRNATPAPQVSQPTFTNRPWQVRA
jgi:hypothetical protein